jgi:two-component system sensor histidine kinase KdpD
VALSVLGVAVTPAIGYRSVGFLFLLGVMVVGFFGSLGSVLLAAGLSALVWNFGFIPPTFTFAISKPEDFILCLSYFAVAIVTGFLTQRIRFHEKLMREREERTNVLYQTLKDISESHSSKEYIEKVTRRIGDLLNASCTVLLRKPDGSLERHSSDGRLEEKELAVALWAYQNQKIAGWSTDTLSQSHSLYTPLRGSSETVGVFIFKPERRIRRLSPDLSNLLHSVVGQLGLALEREVFRTRLGEAQRLQDSERLHQTLLNSISHEIRTPLTVIMGLGEGLRTQTKGNAPLEKMSHDLDEAGDRLNRVIENLLDMSRLNSGVMALKMEWQDLDDVFGVVLRKLHRALEGHPVHVSISADLGMIQADFRLFEHALSNIILNSTQYAGPDSQIWISAESRDGFIRIKIEDDGKGISARELPHIFDKFYRVPGTAPGGTGLGLSIVKSIIELHGGSITALERPPHGVRFIINLPLKPQPQGPVE